MLTNSYGLYPYMRGLYNILNFFIYLYIQHLKLIDTFVMSELFIFYLPF